MLVNHQVISTKTQQQNLKISLLNKNYNLLKIGNFFKFLFFLIIFTTPLFAVDNSQSVLFSLQTGLKNWIPTVKKVCLWVFWTLVVIDFVWTFGKMALSGFEFGEFLSTLIKKIMYIGIFMFLFNVDIWLKQIMLGFSQIATNVSNGIAVTPDNIITSAFKVVKDIWDSQSWFNIPKNLFLLICGVLTLIGFVFMAIDLLMVYIKFYLMNVVIFFALALGGLEHFKSIGLNPILTAIKVGIELFVLQALMGLALTSTSNASIELSKNTTIDLVLQILILALIFPMITRLVPSVIEAVFQGGIGDTGGASSGFKAVMAMTGGMIAGATAGAIGATRAMNAAKDLHFAEGGKGGMDAVKGIAKNLTKASGEHLKDNFVRGRMPNDMANRMQSKTASLNKEKEGGSISGDEKTQSEPYQSGINNK